GRGGRPGGAELLLCATEAGTFLDDEPQKLFDWLRSGARGDTGKYELITESSQDRATILGRLGKLGGDARARETYLGVLVDVWKLALPAWDRHGREVVAEACTGLRARLKNGAPIDELVPPRHPLTRADQPRVEDLFTKRPEFALSPLYFCMSGGHVVDV